MRRGMVSLVFQSDYSSFSLVSRKVNINTATNRILKKLSLSCGTEENIVKAKQCKSCIADVLRQIVKENVRSVKLSFFTSTTNPEKIEKFGIIDVVQPKMIYIIFNWFFIRRSFSKPVQRSPNWKLLKIFIKQNRVIKKSFLATTTIACLAL